ncbi:MAG TPA: hypothetical protein VKC53_03050 [Patescibacteria group bacterium]|nr:hypothetical protein [Patescibacteria group bacterium]
MRIDRGTQSTDYVFSAQEVKELFQSGEANVLIYGSEKLPNGGKKINFHNDGQRAYLPRAIEALAKKLNFEFTGAEPLPPR